MFKITKKLFLLDTKKSFVYLNYGFFDGRDVAQFGRALRSGRRGRWFKSSRPDQLIIKAIPIEFL